MASSNAVRLCPVCQTGYIMGFDLHARCESCLGPAHVGIALTPQSACPYCKLLPQAEKQRRADTFTVAAEDVWPVADTCSLEDAISFFDEGAESDDSAPSTTLFSRIFLPPSGRRGRSLMTTRQVNTQQSLGSLFRQRRPCLRLVLWCTRFQASSRERRRTQTSRSHRRRRLLGVFQTTQTTRSVTRWSPFPPIVPYLSGADAEPSKVKAPVSTYDDVTRVDGISAHGFPPVPPLEPGFAAIFGVKPTIVGGRRPVPPNIRDLVWQLAGSP
ncbi:Hypothetical protein SMAX5B_021316 [Scophthalmus maximus]|uniref:Uncharacterized protein n=1 Tax=Scophthalmus maximus TaxID=52904 RepID=A0A2U9BMV5_SCOMX|nr:Hypothetical protein SMAX5B_021316 [Scophthalmus maximus]